MPASNDTRVRSDGFWNTIASVLPASSGGFSRRRCMRLSVRASSSTSSVAVGERSFADR